MSESGIVDVVMLKWGTDNNQPNMEVMDDELYNALGLNIEDTPLAFVRNLEDEKWRGALAWKHIVLDGVGMNGKRL